MSVELQKLRGELLREALLKGWTRPSEVDAFWTNQLPADRIERWYRKLYKTPETVMPVGPRLVNHFQLGADPEFIFTSGAQRVDARNLFLKAGPAFGADNNGRLCELRPAPSRSALSVLASLWLAMRWMVVFHPETLSYGWRSGAYFSGDGLGGHVHFGRKRIRLREREVLALDRLTHLQFVAGIFDREEGRLRVRQAQGAPAGQPYGALGDTRPQPHGYEYRTLPSWIDNPWLAYFNLVASKLVVAIPDLVPIISEADANLSAEQARSQLRMLLAYFSPLDDDARLAFAILTRKGLPLHSQGLDFKASWGLYAHGPFGSQPEASKPRVWPEAIEPSQVEENELSLAMLEGRPPELTSLKTSWVPNTLPDGYYHCISNTETKASPGLGEFVMGLCFYKEAVVEFFNMGHGSKLFNFPASLSKRLMASGLIEQLKAVKLYSTWGADGLAIHVNATKDYSLEQLLLGRKIILESQALPLWDIATVRPESFAQWQAFRPAKKAPRPSRVEFQGGKL